MANYTMRTNPYISATQGFVDAYQRGLELALRKRQLDIQARRYQQWETYTNAQMRLWGKRDTKPVIRSGAVPLIRYDPDTDTVKTIYTPPDFEAEAIEMEELGDAAKVAARQYKDKTETVEPAGKRAWLPFNEYYSHKNILEQYKNYRAQMGYSEKTPEQRRRLDETWDEEWLGTRNAKWQPASSDVQALRGRDKMLFPQKRPTETPVSKPFMLKDQSKRIRIIDPNGKEGTIPESQLDEALRQGYKIWKR